MPIPIDAFEKASDPEEEKILRFLNSNPDKAYTAEEIAHSIGRDIDSPWVALEFFGRLRGLADRRIIRWKTVGDKSYYAIILGPRVRPQ